MTISGAAQPTDVTVCNLAIARIGSGKQIDNLDSDASNEARACRLVYYLARDKVLRAFPWPFATKFATLGLVSNYPTSEYRYAYRLPSDCLAVRRIPSGSRNDVRDSEVTYRIIQDSQGLLLLTDYPNATQTAPNPILTPDIEYTFQAYNAALWPSDFIEALTWLVASEIAPQLGRGKKREIVKDCLDMYASELSKARAAALNEEKPDPRPEAEHIRARCDDFTDSTSRYPYYNNPGGYSVK